MMRLWAVGFNVFLVGLGLCGGIGGPDACAQRFVKTCYVKFEFDAGGKKSIVTKIEYAFSKIESYSQKIGFSSDKLRLIS